MSDAATLCKWLEQTWVASSVRESLWLFPAIETLHLFGIVVLVGTTTVFDLRLLGWTLRRQRVSELARLLLPWSWAGFGIQVATGFLLFASEASKCYGNPAFRLKMLLLLLAGANALLFHVTANQKLTEWDEDAVPPTGAKLAGAVSILLWFGIVAAGRFIGFV